ncbi:hypothetical protein FisN_13Lh086 [Fistulifera solaris]|uniref:MYND-type domain-containing protein n=1 Tax=Fistulifera solaris TaxID=1519565 RepID=A0A1Z5JFT2_FISSO|nr:hypothetical protein FisN_13Lh086 [Fistulifera solaris]|eukprot:GAX12621.1 hypothetical protein FisN_13Lh086 [Fistulifera solaris]
MKDATMCNFIRAMRNCSVVEGGPSYEGKDLRLQTVPWCAACHSRPTKGLLCCASCRTAWYCNSTCQKAHYKSHKEICVTVARNLNILDEQAELLRNAEEAYFETQIGAFGRYHPTLIYMGALKDVVKSLVRAAQASEMQCVWERAFDYTLELQRLDVLAPLDSQALTAFILLNLHRDDDAFDFIRSWMQTDLTGHETARELAMRHDGIQKGEWFFPREKNSRYLNMFEVCPNVDYRSVPVAFLVVLLVIKCRLVAAYDATCKSIDLALATTDGQRIQEVKELVTDMLINKKLMNIVSQRKQVVWLVNAIHGNNAIMLPAILNPEPLLEKYSREGTQDQAAEAFFTLFYGVPCLIRIPGVEAMLEQRFGKKPFYTL